MHAVQSSGMAAPPTLSVRDLTIAFRRDDVWTPAVRNVSFDIGQGVVVIDGHVVAVEDIEGTDALLARVARLRTEGRLRAREGRGVLVKAPKSNQDLRFDLPTTGLRTVEGIVTAKLGGIATIAGHTIAADAQAMIEAADRAGVFVTGLPL